MIDRKTQDPAKCDQKGDLLKYGKRFYPELSNIDQIIQNNHQQTDRTIEAELPVTGSK